MAFPSSPMERRQLLFVLGVEVGTALYEHPGDVGMAALGSPMQRRVLHAVIGGRVSAGGEGFSRDIDIAGFCGSKECYGSPQ